MELREGIIIKTIKYQESSKILYILTMDGLISGLLRNCLSLKSKNYSYSHEGTIIGFDLTKSKKSGNSKSFDIITSGAVINRLYNIHNNYDKLLKIVEVFSIVYDVHSYVEDYKNLYYLVKNIILRISNNHNNNFDKYYIAIFKLKLLYLLGVGPVFNKCCVCGSLDKTYFDVSSGGMVCANHKASAIYYEEEVVKIIEILYLGKIELFNNDIFATFDKYYIKVNELIAEYYNYHMPLNKKSKDIIDKLS